MPSVAAMILSVGDRWVEHEQRDMAQALKAARNAGYEAVLAHAPLWENEAGGSLSALAASCRATGLRLLAHVDVLRFPIGHPLVEQNPEAFAVRRGGDERAPIDPRRPMPAKGTAIARLRMSEFGDLFADALAERLKSLVRHGVSGFRFVSSERIGAALLRQLIGRLRADDADLQFIAGGDEPALARARLDFVVANIGGWDLQSPAFFDDLWKLRNIAPVLCELDATADAHLSSRIEAAALLGRGVIVPLDLLSDTSPAREAALNAPALANKVAGFNGSPQRLSTSADPVTALLLPEGADVRLSTRAALLLINTSVQPQPAPEPSTLASAGSAFLRVEADPTPLSPGEVRLLPVSRPDPIRTAAPLVEPRALAAAPRLVVEEVEPSVSGGDFPVKRVVGDVVTVTANIFTDGHEQLGAELRWRAMDEEQWSAARMEPLGNDRWRAEFPLERMGRHEFVVEGWLDRFGGFRRDFAKKLDADVAQPVDHAEGRALVEEAMRRCKGKLGTALKQRLGRIAKAKGEDSAELLLDEELAALMAQADERRHSLLSRPQTVDAERVEARFSSWYELFPRSITDDKARHGTFAGVVEQLPRIRAMGFDTLYFPPIHPIGRTNRKGPNNTLTPGPDDPGSPYAIGSAEGGHDAIHPELGSFADFGQLVAAAHEHGLEIALDFAIQASPDHPWLTEHPGWFAWRPDGSMKYAENPPKKYQDIVNVDFYGPDAIPGLWEALRDVVLLWVKHGVKTFRVDNPHTKPLPFWEWVIAEVRGAHPEVIFLSEAFTRPTMMYRLAKAGFSQSYTYFTWRDGKQELIDYITELTTTAPKEFYRPHFFVNTPDINPFFLQTSGRAGFRIRAVLAATLSGLWGVYSGFELCEYEPLGPSKEEYLDSEKFEIRPRPPRAPGDIVEDITLLNHLRRAHPALQTHLNTRFYLAHNDNIIWYGKPSPGGGEMIMVMVNLDPHNAQACDFEVPLWEFGLPDDATIAVEDLAAGHRFDWHGKFQHIALTPDEPYRIWRLSLPGGAA